MLIKIDKHSNVNSKYICDMCKNNLYGKDRLTIYVGNNSGTSKKTWDLCPKCFKIVKKNIDNWHNKSLRKCIDKNVK